MSTPQAGPISVPEALPTELGCQGFSREGPVCARYLLSFDFWLQYMYYTHGLKKPKWLKVKVYFFLFGLKVVLVPLTVFSLSVSCVLLKYVWLSASTASSTFPILNSWTFPSSLIFLWNNLALIWICLGVLT